MSDIYLTYLIDSNIPNKKYFEIPEDFERLKFIFVNNYEEIKRDLINKNLNEYPPLYFIIDKNITYIKCILYGFEDYSEEIDEKMLGEYVGCFDVGVIRLDDSNVKETDEINIYVDKLIDIKFDNRIEDLINVFYIDNKEDIDLNEINYSHLSNKKYYYINNKKEIFEKEITDKYDDFKRSNFKYNELYDSY